MDNELNVKAGDKVIYYPGGQWGSKRVAIVSKVTPTGRIKVGSTYYDKIGREIGGDTWHRTRISQATEADIQEIIQKEFVRGVCHKLQTLKSLSYIKAVAINTILEGSEQPHE